MDYWGAKGYVGLPLKLLGGPAPPPPPSSYAYVYGCRLCLTGIHPQKYRLTSDFTCVPYRHFTLAFVLGAIPNVLVSVSVDAECKVMCFLYELIR